MRAFDLYRPESLDDAQEHAKASTMYKAGGIDLLDRTKERVATPETVIDLMALRENMNTIARRNDTVSIGALATLAQLADAAELKIPAIGALIMAAADAATPQVRNRATVGGNLLQTSRCWYLRNARFACAHSGRGDTCLAQEGEHRYHAILGTDDCIRVHPSNLAPALLVLGARVELQRGDQTREIPLQELYPEEPLAELAEHTLRDGEVLTAVQFAVPAAGTRSVYRESREKQGHDWATTAAAVRVRRDGSTIAEAAICLGAVAPNPLVRDKAAAALIGQEPSQKLFTQVAELAFAGADPLSQNAYKVPVGKAVLIDALRQATGNK